MRERETPTDCSDDYAFYCLCYYREGQPEEELEEDSPDPSLLLSSPKISVRLALQAIAPGPRQRLIAQSYMALEKRILMLAERSRRERDDSELPSADDDLGTASG